MPRGFFPLALWNYTPILSAQPVPAIESYAEAPNRTICISEALVPYLLGLLEIYRWPDRFEGTQAEKDHATGLFQDLIIALTGPALACGESGMIQGIRVQECALQVTYDGVIWVTVGSLSECAIPGPTGPQGETGPTGPAGTCDCADSPAPRTDAPNPADNRCGAAHYIAEHLIAVLNYNLTQIDDGIEAANAIINLLNFVGIGVIVGEIYEALTALATLGTSLVRLDMTPDRTEALICYLYCNLPDSQMQQVDVDALKTEVEQSSKYGNALSIALRKTVNFLALAWFQRYQYAGSTVPMADCRSLCTDCPEPTTWCRTWNFLTDSGSDVWSSCISNDNDYHTSWALGSGWQTSDLSPNYSMIMATMPRDGTLTEIEATFANSSDTSAWGARATENNSEVFTWHYNELPFGSANPLTGVAQLAIGIRSAGNITSITLRGTGENPFGEDNCN